MIATSLPTSPTALAAYPPLPTGARAGAAARLAEGLPVWRRCQPSSPEDPFSRVLADYEPITLARAKGVALLRRVDTKYVLGTVELLDALGGLSEDYWVLDVDGVRVQRYQTLYFDTPTLDLYLRHHQGHADRYKVRSRTYVDSGVSYFEVKHKNNKDWTTKRRIRTGELVARLTPEARAFLGECSPLGGAPLRPTLENDFRRITLVSKRYPERLTLDLDVEFGWRHSGVTLAGLAIAEVKQDRLNRSSDFFQAMRALGVRPAGISKYCVGVALLYDDVKHNNLKPRLRLIERITGGTHVRRYS